ncbi:MAG: hypothetical protein N3D80_04150, partial [Ignavibacterium album]|nr:hypothetical protein [Ignavibacterium album]
YGPWYIGLATSIDGINWIKRPNPVLYSGTGWENQISCNYVLKHEGQYYMFYSGRNGTHNWKIGLAISNDGINFTRYSGNPILVNELSWEGSGVFNPNIIKENNSYKMVFSDALGRGFGWAYSSDGIHWTKDPINPFFKRENTVNGWGNVNIAYPNMIKLNNEFRIYYCGASNSPNPIYKIGFLRRTN